MRKAACTTPAAAALHDIGGGWRAKLKKGDVICFTYQVAAAAWCIHRNILLNTMQK